MNITHRIIGRLGPMFIIIFSLIPLLLWWPYASFANAISTFRSISQITALVGTILFSLSFILAIRLQIVEEFFDGLNRVYIYHHLIGAIGFILLLIHPMALVISYIMISLPAAVALIVPSTENIPVLFGSISLFIMIILMILTFFLRLEYDIWKKTHTWLGSSLFFAAGHALLIGSTLERSIGLKLYIIVFLLFGAVSFVFRLFAKRLGVNWYTYIVSEAKIHGDVTMLTLIPETKMLQFMPGQFGFIKVTHLGISKSMHPFSFASAPSESVLCFGIKSLGDYSETIKLLTPGSEVQIEGPFGHFSYTRTANKKQVWIGGGIGITPFRSMLRSLHPNDTREIVLYYCVRDAKEGFLDQDLAEAAALRPMVRYTFWSSKDKGRLTAHTLALELPDLHDRDIFVCGPPAMMEGLRAQLVEAGVSSRKIHTEEFSM